MRKLLDFNVYDHTKRFWLCWLFYAIVLLGQIIEYATLNYLITKNGDNQEIWSVNYEQDGCGTRLETPIQTSSLIDLGIFGVGPGAYFGLLL